MKTSDFDYELPKELIAQTPAVPRDSCRLLSLDKGTGEISHEHFGDIVGHLRPGDLLVANETRVLPARLVGRKAGSGGEAEMLLLHHFEDGCWECLVRPGKRLREGSVVEFRRGGAKAQTASPVLMKGEVLGISDESGSRRVSFTTFGADFNQALHECGAVPLPPYISGYQGDAELYQTVYSKAEKSAAAPTAGLHFTEELIERICEMGVMWETVELQVGLDTFRPVSCEDPKDHLMHTERYSVPQRVVDAIEAAHEAGGRVIAVGTTSVRSLESAWSEEEDKVTARDEEATSLFILPGFKFHVVDAIITNFHVPRSTLMMLICAFAGRDKVMHAYECAVHERYRFLSFGDAMLIE